MAMDKLPAGMFRNSMIQRRTMLLYIEEEPIEGYELLDDIILEMDADNLEKTHRIWCKEIRKLGILLFIVNKK